MKDVRFLSKTYLWGQGLYQLLQFVLVEYGETQAILACTNLSMSAGDIIEAYACCFKILYEPCFYTNFSDGNTINIKFSITKSSYKTLSLIKESETVRLRHLAIMVLLLESHCFFCLRFLSSGLTMVRYSGLLLFSCPHALIAPRPQRDPRQKGCTAWKEIAIQLLKLYFIELYPPVL